VWGRRSIIVDDGKNGGGNAADFTCDKPAMMAGLEQIYD